MATSTLGVCATILKSSVLQECPYLRRLDYNADLLQIGDIRILVYPGDHPPIHVHVVTKDRSLEVKIDISGSEPVEMRPAKDEQMKTTAKHTQRALRLCRDNLEILREGAEKYYAAQ